MRWRIPGWLSRIPPRLAKFFPSEIGTYPFDTAFVLNDYVRNFLVNSRGTPIRKVLSVGLPRYKEYAHVKEQEKKQSKLRILFISQGFLWHNERASDELQHREFANVHNALMKVVPEAEIVVRVHPRDDAQRWARYGVTIETSELSARNSIAKSDLIIGLTSTCLLEAVWLDKPVICTMTEGEYWRFRRSFINDDSIRKALSVAALEEMIQTAIRIEDSGEASSRRAVPYNADTVRTIVGEIIANNDNP